MSDRSCVSTLQRVQGAIYSMEPHLTHSRETGQSLKTGAMHPLSKQGLSEAIDISLLSSSQYLIL